jgi:hypothetical protein
MRKLFRPWWFWLIMAVVLLQDILGLRHSLRDYQIERREQEWRNRAAQAATGTLG